MKSCPVRFPVTLYKKYILTLAVLLKKLNILILEHVYIINIPLLACDTEDVVV